MTKFLESLGGKLAERWLALLVLPSALLMVVAAVGAALGHRRWNDVGLLLSELNRLAAEPALRSTGTMILVLAGMLATSAGLGLAATALGVAVERVWLGTRPRQLADRRRRRWEDVQAAFNRALVEAAKAERMADTKGWMATVEAATAQGAVDAKASAMRARDLNARRNRISLVPPTRPFWLGDRIAAVEVRVWDAYRLDLATAWPRLWLTLPQEVQTEISTARARLAAATRLVGWAIGYLAVGAMWWPSAVIGAVAAVTAWHRARIAGASFAELTEAAVDLHGRRLADSLGIPCEGPLTENVGAEITTLLRKRT